MKLNTFLLKNSKKKNPEGTSSGGKGIWDISVEHMEMRENNRTRKGRLGQNLDKTSLGVSLVLLCNMASSL